MTALEVVAVYRLCRDCGAFKPLEHFLERKHGQGHRGVARSWHICASCRGNTVPSLAARKVSQRD